MSDNTSTKGQMSKSDASRIQSTQAKGGKDMAVHGFASRAQSAGDKNVNAAANRGKDKSLWGFVNRSQTGDAKNSNAAAAGADAQGGAANAGRTGWSCIIQ